MSPETWSLIAIAAMNALTAFFAWKTHHNIQTLEVNTNSIKDALVATTAKSSKAEGVLQGTERIQKLEEQIIDLRHRLDKANEPTWDPPTTR